MRFSERFTAMNKERFLECVADDQVKPITDKQIAEVEQALFDSGIEDGFVQEADSASGEFIPAFDFTGV